MSVKELRKSVERLQALSAQLEKTHRPQSRQRIARRFLQIFSQIVTDDVPAPGGES